MYTPIDISMLYGNANVRGVEVNVEALAVQATALGFDGGRFFGGRLEELDGRPQRQEPDQQTLDRTEDNAELLDAYGLEMHNVIVTDGKREYDFVRHAADHGRIAARCKNVRILEGENEIGHETQAEPSKRRIQDLYSAVRAAGFTGVFTAGALEAADELIDGAYWPAETGEAADTHYNRGRWPFYENVAHGANELRTLSNTYKKARISGEPGRADHVDVQGQQRAYGYTLGISATAFGIRTVYHASQPRDCVPMSGPTLDGAIAMVRGHRALPRGRYEFQNANNTGNWRDSPVKSAAFMEGPASNGDKTVWRAWSFRHADSGQWFLVLIGESVDRSGLELQNSFALGAQVDRVDNLVHVFTMEQR